MARAVLVDYYYDGREFQKGNTCLVIEQGTISRVVGFSKVEDIPRIIGEDIEIIDFRGRLVTPGLIDSHNHFTLTALKMFFQVDLGNAGSISGVYDLMKKGERQTGEWLLGYNLNEFTLLEGRLPTARELDEISPDLPVVISHSSEHSIICNSRALQIAGITRGTPDPMGSTIGRYKDGESNGILYESAAMNLVKRWIPEYNLDDYVKAISHASAEYRKNGLTAVKDVGGTGDDVNEERRVEAINFLSESGGLKVRVGLSIPVYSLQEIDSKIKLSRKVKENDLVKFTGFKMFLDGSGLQRTGWMKQEWSRNYFEKDEGNFGMHLWNLDEFREALVRLASVGPTISIHTIGDRAVSEAISIINSLTAENRAKSDFAFVHANSPDPDDIIKLQENGISVETQPCDIYFLGHAYLGNVGPVRGDLIFPLKTMLDSAITVCNGSDSPVMRFEPIYGILSSMRREMRHRPKYDAGYNAGERLTLDESLLTYTSNCASVMHWPEIGTISEGKFADIIVWKRMPERFDEDLSSDAVFHSILFSGN